jgi:hypothetical protein
VRTVVATLIVLALAGCGASEEADRPADDAATTTSAAPTQAFDQELHDELIAMLEQDQAERMEGAIGDDRARTERLKEIVAEHGWPTISLVGEDGEDAAWAIAQHADHDPAFQEQAVQLIGEAVERGEASPGNLAYLTDRVAVGKGEPQTYGTQVGCTSDGQVQVAPLADEDGVDGLRAEVGLGPLADYLAEMEQICAQDAETSTP